MSRGLASPRSRLRRARSPVCAGTSLPASIVIGGLAAVAKAAYGNVNLGEGLLIGVPGAVGVVAGTANVVPERALSVAAVQVWLAWQLARQVGLPSRLATR